MILSRFVAAFALNALVFGMLSFGQTAALPAAPTSPAPPPDPKILEDGGFSIEPIYWLTQAQPALFGGKETFGNSNLTYPGKSRKGLGAEIGIPAGRANTVRLSYFRVLGSGNSTVGAQGSTIFSEAYSAGDYIVASYNLQNVKLSWDYLSYTFKNRIRFKTLYEVQWVAISTSVSAPLIPQTVDANTGDTDTNSSTGTKNLVYPTFGAEFEQPVTKHLRWEVKGSGFGLPHHAVIWDAQADVAVRFSSLEFFAGGKAFHFKTSENTDQYFTDTLQGAFVGIRYYLSKPAN